MAVCSYSGTLVDIYAYYRVTRLIFSFSYLVLESHQIFCSCYIQSCIYCRRPVSTIETKTSLMPPCWCSVCSEHGLHYYSHTSVVWCSSTQSVSVCQHGADRFQAAARRIWNSALSVTQDQYINVFRSFSTRYLGITRTMILKSGLALYKYDSSATTHTRLD